MSRLRLAPAPARNEQIARRQPRLLAVTPDVRHGAFNPNPTAKKIQVGYSQRSNLTKPQAAIGQHEDDRPIPLSGLRQCCYLVRAQESLGRALDAGQLNTNRWVRWQAAIPDSKIGQRGFDPRHTLEAHR
jgi:hypothetical protein